MDAKEPPVRRPQDGVARLRETKPDGPGPFAEILKTSAVQGGDDSAPREHEERPQSDHIEGLSDEALEQLERDEKRYAAARRAATAGGRTTLYE